MRLLERAPFDPAGRVVARRALTMGTRVYEPGQELSKADAAELAPRLGALYQLGQIDTPVPAPAPQPTKQQQLQHRR